MRPNLMIVPNRTLSYRTATQRCLLECQVETCLAGPTANMQVDILNDISYIDRQNISTGIDFLHYFNSKLQIELFVFRHL